MKLFTGLLICLFVVLSIFFSVQCACASSGLLGPKPMIKLQPSIQNQLQLKHDKTDDDSILKKILNPKLHKELRLDTDLHGLASLMSSSASVATP